ncbi:hypothetical protein QYF61_021434 [Mycteria americana]|uniref:Uncharacterized protein n=1 Tax=Mycteria americana TaxID=33587 RepID=A0AAN7NPQ5_MYCAM|nr:hypothetical protein QYF61_021434 [Mycteria americana]
MIEGVGPAVHNLQKHVNNKSKKLGELVDTPDACAAIRRYLDRVEQWTNRNRMKISKGNLTVLHLGGGGNSPMHTFGTDHLESSFSKKDARILVDYNLNTSQQCVLAAKANSISWAALGRALPAH